MKRVPVFILLFLVFVLIIAVSNSNAQLKEFEPAPDFSLISTEGDTVTLSEFQGKVVVLHFWKNN